MTHVHWKGLEYLRRELLKYLLSLRKFITKDEKVKKYATIVAIKFLHVLDKSVSVAAIIQVNLTCNWSRSNLVRIS